MIVEIKGTGQRVKFPDGMNQDQMLQALRSNFFRQQTSAPTVPEPLPQSIEPVTPSLSQTSAQKVADFLLDKGIISDRYRAQDVGSTLSGLAEFLPGIGDATAGDEFGRALAQGDKTGMALGALGVVPVVGDAGKYLMSKVKDVVHYNDMFDLSPEQLAQQLRSTKPENVVDGVYIEQTKFGEKRFNPDGSVDIVKDGEVLRSISSDDAGMVYKNKIMKNIEDDPIVKAAAEKRKADFDAERARLKIESEQGYKMQHTAPMRDDNPSGDNLSDAYGDDIYSFRAKQYYGTGAAYDDKAIAIIQEMKGKPEKTVTIYRAVPKSVKEINPSDWVTTTKEYAEDHMAGENGWHILSKKVKAKDIANDGNSIHEFGYDPVNK